MCPIFVKGFSHIWFCQCGFLFNFHLVMILLKLKIFQSGRMYWQNTVLAMAVIFKKIFGYYVNNTHTILIIIVLLVHFKQSRLQILLLFGRNMYQNCNCVSGLGTNLPFILITNTTLCFPFLHPTYLWLRARCQDRMQHNQMHLLPIYKWQQRDLCWEQVGHSVPTMLFTWDQHSPLLLLEGILSLSSVSISQMAELKC